VELESIHMATLNDIKRQILPHGTTSSGGAVSWDSCPEWPPDLFAFVGTLVERCSCYVDTFFFDKANSSLFKRAGDWGLLWAENLEVPPEIQAEWQSLMTEYGDMRIGVAEIPPPTQSSFQNTIMSLMIAADEACRNLGFMNWDSSAAAGKNSFNWVYLAEFEKYLKSAPATTRYLKHLPYSLCVLVDPADVTVQPKGVAPIAGCSLSRFCNHLSLISSPHGAQTIWYPSAMWRERGELPGKAINLLLIPFPYHLDCESFSSVSDVPGPSGPYCGTFRTTSDWLYEKRSPARRASRNRIKPIDLANFIVELVEKARSEVGRVHAVILPECALDEKLASSVVLQLHQRLKLALFITGFEDRTGVPTNGVYLWLMSDRFDRQYKLVQGKHHPWYADESQVRRYNLGASLPLSTKHWWESLTLGPRKVHFVGIDHNVCMSVLICEDLARIEPAQQTLRAIGPNLVVALLMDGSQLKERWSARYATVLADEPGSSVLTLTCVGLIKRSLSPDDRGDYAIGLWKEFGGSIQELRLPRSAHALVLSLSMVQEAGHTPDGREDLTQFEELGTTRLRLALMRPVKATEHVPPWLRYGDL